MYDFELSLGSTQPHIKLKVILIHRKTKLIILIIYYKRPNILVLWPLQGCKAKKAKKNLKIKYGSKCLELSNSARNAEIAKKIQKVLNRWSSLNLAFIGLKLEI